MKILSATAATTFLLITEAPVGSDACRDFERHPSLPDHFQRAGSAMFPEGDELSWFSNGPCTCYDSPRFNRPRGEPGLNGLYWSCYPTGTIENRIF
jgi:hypothetical protein